MSKTPNKILKTFGILITTMLFAGCVVVINNGKPTTDEQNLLNIQQATSQEVAQINQKIQGGNYSLPEVQELVNQGKKVVEDSLEKIDKLNLPARTKDLANKTKEYLQQADQTYQSFLQTSSQAANQTGQKLQELMNNLQTMSQPLLNMGQQLQNMQSEFLKEIQQASNGS